MKIGKHDVTGEAKYEQLYLNIKKWFKRMYLAYDIVLIFELIFILILHYNSQVIDVWTLFGIICIIGIRLGFLGAVANSQWHDNSVEQSHGLKFLLVFGTNKNSADTKEENIDTLRFSIAVINTILCGMILLSALASFPNCLIFYIDYNYWYFLVAVLDCIVTAVIMSFILYYIIQYFKYFRWTWEELQLPPEERKAHYKAKKSAERQKKREEREAKRESGQSSRTENCGFFAKRNEKPAAKIVKSQADRRAELENLKKLYDEGLIDEEEYKKAREKALDIQ